MTNKTETERSEEIIAVAWSKGIYSNDEAMLAAESLGLNFLSIIEQFKNIQIDQEIEING